MGAVACRTRQTGAVDVARALHDVARAGPFFAVSTGPAGAVPDGAQPVADVLAGRGDALVRRIAHVRTVLGSDDRVAASVTFQGLAALLVAAPFAAAVVHGVLPALTPSALHWTPRTDGPWALWCADPDGRAVPDPADAAAGLADLLLDQHLGPLAAAVRERVAVSEKVLHGNTASTVAATRRLVVAQWPAAHGRATEVAERLLDSGVLAGTGERIAARAPDRGWSFRRRSCCLYYRARDGGLCGDCVLVPR